MKTVAIVFISFLSLLLSTFGGNVILNNWRLSNFSDQLFDYSLPKGANLITQEAKVGVLTGSGNHCDFMAILEIQSSLDIETIREHYAGFKINPAVKGSDAGQLLEIEPLSDDHFSIRIIDAPNTRWFDLRCT